MDFESEKSLPMIVRYSTQLNNGIEQQHIMRHAIGYIVRGDKFIHMGNKCLHAKKGDIFFLNEGIHNIEDVPERYSQFEQIVFYFTSEEIKHIITSFNLTYGLRVNNKHCCSKCHNGNAVTIKAPRHLDSFFKNAVNYILDDGFAHDSAAESIKTTELIYLIASQADSCLKYKLIDCIDSEKSTFEQTIYANIFNDIPLELLAELCKRSPTAFKKEFKQRFQTSPHQWFLAQRLSHARLMLISTHYPIAEIGAECAFLNTSHFIKLFKRQYKCTPSVFRQRYFTAMDKQAQIDTERIKAGECKAV